VRKLQKNLRLVSALLLSATLAGSGLHVARADDTDAHRLGRAEELFIAGKKRLAMNDYAAACSLLAQSYLFDAATGSLLALALCHDRQGKLASSLREYEEVVARSRKEGRKDREQAALDQIASLMPRLSTLTLRLEEPKPKLKLIIKINGDLIAPDQVGRALPIDGGFVLVEAEAEGKTSWRTGVTLAESNQALTVTIPLLGPSATSTPPAAKPAAADPAFGPAQTARPHEPRFSTVQRTGIAFMSVGAAAAGVDVGFTIQAVRKNKSSDSGCYDDVCTKSARNDRLDARTAGNIATAATVAAGAFAAGGLIAYLVGTKRKKDTRLTPSERVHASAWADPHGIGAMVSGGF
jgi:hypothetical protein